MPHRRDVLLRRVYDHEGRDESGRRVLVDRLWPRGVSKADAALDDWFRDVAPSTELRRWYGHDPQRFEEFARRYRAELRTPPASIALERLVAVARRETVELVTATRDVEHSGAQVLLEVVTNPADSTPDRQRATGPTAVGG
jgi:uncharacterized protein YeaO (DUF488 family)